MDSSGQPGAAGGNSWTDSSRPDDGRPPHHSETRPRLGKGEDNAIRARDGDEVTVTNTDTQSWTAAEKVLLTTGNTNLEWPKFEKVYLYIYIVVSNTINQFEATILGYITEC